MSDPVQPSQSEPERKEPEAPKPTQVRHAFVRGFTNHFWDLVGIKSAGDSMTDHALTVEQKGKFLASAVIFSIIFITLGITLRGCYDGLRGGDSKNEDLATALAKNQSALNIERSENDKLRRQHGDDQSIITGLRNFNAGLPHKQTPAELMGLCIETNYIFSTNFTYSTVTITNLLSLAPTPYALDFFQLQRIQNQLKDTTPYEYHTGFNPIDPNGMIVAKQLGQVFLASGFKADAGIPQDGVFFTNGISILIHHKPDGKTTKAFESISEELKQRIIWDFAPVPTNQVWFFINRQGL